MSLPPPPRGGLLPAPSHREGQESLASLCFLLSASFSTILRGAVLSLYKIFQHPNYIYFHSSWIINSNLMHHLVLITVVLVRPCSTQYSLPPCLAGLLSGPLHGRACGVCLRSLSGKNFKHSVSLASVCTFLRGLTHNLLQALYL